MDVKFKTPVNFYIPGRTQSGKSHFTRCMLRHLEELFIRFLRKSSIVMLSRTISLNSHYLVIFRNPRDSLGISTLARQMFPGRTDYLMESFCNATSRPYGYLVIDCHQLTPENMGLRTNILPVSKVSRKKNSILIRKAVICSRLCFLLFWEF